MTENRTLIRIADDYSPFPFGRNRRDSENSGERFRDDILLPALRDYDTVIVDLDGVAGLPSSFWEEAIGGLIRAGLPKQQLLGSLEFTTTDDELKPYVRLAWRYIDEADKAGRKPS